MASRRPVLLTIAGIFSLVFGVFGFLCGLCGAGMHLALLTASRQGNAGPGDVSDLLGFLEREAPGYQAVELGKATMVVILGVVATVVGTGLLCRQRWARWCGVVYAVVAIAVHLGYLGYELGLVLPATARWQAQQALVRGGPPASVKVNQFSTGFGVVVGNIVPAGFAVFLLVAMLSSPGKQAFARPRRDDRWQADEDYDDDDSPRRRCDSDDDW